MIASEPVPASGSRQSRSRATAAPRWLAALALTGIGFLAVLSGCGREEPKAAVSEPPRPVRTLTVASLAPEGTWSLAGDVRPRIEVRYGFRVGGRILERRVQVGDRVAPGQVLARLDKEEGIVIGELDPARINDVRASLPALEHRVRL